MWHGLWIAILTSAISVRASEVCAEILVSEEASLLQTRSSGKGPNKDLSCENGGDRFEAGVRGKWDGSAQSRGDCLGSAEHCAACCVQECAGFTYKDNECKVYGANVGSPVSTNKKCRYAAKVVPTTAPAPTMDPTVSPEPPTMGPTVSPEPPTMGPTVQPEPPTMAPTVSPTQPSPTPAPTTESEEAEAVLAQHNVYRCMHGVQHLVWDMAVAAKAQEWADTHSGYHSTWQFRTTDDGYYGENWASEEISENAPLFQGTTLVDHVKDWYSEIERCDGPNGYGTTLKVRNEAGQPVGHYTQLVWSTTTRLGCGKSWAAILYPQAPERGYVNSTWYVCMYAEGGNEPGLFESKVLSPTKTEAECQ